MKTSVEYYQGLIAFRKAHPALRMTSQAEILASMKVLDTGSNDVIAILNQGGNGEDVQILTIINTSDNSGDVGVYLPEGWWDVYVFGSRAGTEVLTTIEGGMDQRFSGGPESVTILVKRGEVKNGLTWDEDGEIRYYVDGVATYAGLVQDEGGNYYYINSTKKAVRNCTYGIGAAKTNGLLPAGIYEFDAEGRMVNPPVLTKNGLVVDEDGEIRYYVDGVATYAGLVQDAEGNYYYINSTKKAVKNCTYGIGAAKTNGLLPAGVYEFGADGKMINPPTAEDLAKNGLVLDADGEIRYYVDGVATYAGLVRDAEGNYYYINSTKKAVKNCRYGIGEGKTNGLLSAGVYEFGADGKMINPPQG